MPDPIEAFKDLQTRYPGSKQVRSSQQPRVSAQASADSRAWDARPTVMTIDGVETNLFTVGDLGTALGRSSATLRKWEELGHLPPADFRYPGRTRNGQYRLYTRRQVEGLIAIAAEEGVLDGHHKIGHTRFTERARHLFGQKAS